MTKYEENLQKEAEKLAFKLFNIDYQQLSSISQNMCYVGAKHVLEQKAESYDKGYVAGADGKIGGYWVADIQNDLKDLGYIEQKEVSNGK